MINHTKWVSCLFLCVFLLAACQPAQNMGNNPGMEEAASELAEGDTAYPVEDIIILPEIEYAYPINDEDLARFIRTWDLSEQLQDGTLNESSTKAYSFYADGRFDLRTENETIAGQWTAQLSAMDAMLTLSYETNEVQVLEILELSETLLKLGYFQNGIMIEEIYLPAN